MDLLTSATPITEESAVRQTTIANQEKIALTKRADPIRHIQIPVYIKVNYYSPL